MTNVFVYSTCKCLNYVERVLTSLSATEFVRVNYYWSVVREEIFD